MRPHGRLVETSTGKDQELIRVMDVVFDIV
jgi:hypothetical protein